jgi:hypothetical protein
MLPIFFISACGMDMSSETLLTEKFTVIMPEESMFECKTIVTFPDSTKLTDIQVGSIIVELQKNNLECSSNMKAIKQLLIDAKTTVEK